MSNFGFVNYKKAALYYMIGTLFNKGISFLAIPIFTWLLSTADYGVISTYNAWVSILTIFLSYALYMAIRLAFIDYKDVIDDFMSVSISFSLVTGIIVGLTAIILTSILNLKYSPFLIALCVFHSLFDGLILDYSMYLQMQYKYRARTALLILPNLLGIIISVLCIKYIKLEHLYLGRIIPTAFIIAFTGVFVTILVYRKSHVLFNKEYLKYGLSISVPLIFHGVALSLLSTSDRIMISWLVDTSQTGVYSLIYNFGMAATVITTGFQGIWDPWLLNRISQNEYGLINIRARQYCTLITTAMVVIIMIGPEIIRLLVKQDYWDGIFIIPPIVIANYVIYIYTFYVNVEHFSKKTLRISIHTAIAAVLNIILNYIFIPEFGYTAAAYTTVTSYVVCLFMHANYSKKLINDLFPARMFIIPLCQITLFTVAFYVGIKNPHFRWMCAIVFTAINIIKNKELIRTLFLQTDRKEVL